MNRHEWEEVDSQQLSMKCIHCGQLIDLQDTQHWNLQIFADCPLRFEA